MGVLFEVFLVFVTGVCALSSRAVLPPAQAATPVAGGCRPIVLSCPRGIISLVLAGTTLVTLFVIVDLKQTHLPVLREALCLLRHTEMFLK